MNSKTFHETSGFPAAFPILLIFQSVVAFIIMMKEQESPWTVIAIAVPLALLFSFSRLTVKMHPEYLEYRFFPFMLRHKKIPWNEIREIRLVHADPLWDFGGWGVRLSRKYGKAFITGGNEAVFLRLKNGKKRTFSIQDRVRVKKFFNGHEIPYDEETENKKSPA